ncbi:hypothetical protein [Variovorax sp. J31P207]|uniref:NACHT domain-containing protein n=1 Tax=Variovorax sp. J31P207 TaxID=3053510 RepID=UPI002578408E|nr:hypothetical protein [Variovorax sp. J31P207]MDM0071242.1 hypothetical protein [Variovorax sp. J31P207]
MMAIIRDKALYLAFLILCMPSASMAHVAIKIDNTEPPRMSSKNLIPDRTEYKDTQIIAENKNYWIVSNKIYRIDNFIATEQDLGVCEGANEGKMIRMPRTDYKVTALVEYNDRWYVGTDHGLFYLWMGRLRPVLTEKRCFPSKKRDEKASDTNEERGINKLWKLGTHLWFNATDYGFGRVGSDHSAHGWTDTYTYSGIADMEEQALWVVTRYKDGDFLIRLSDLEPATSDKMLPDSERVVFNGWDNKPNQSERRILSAKRLNGILWVVASDGIYVIIGMIGYKIQDSPYPAETDIPGPFAPDQMLETPALADSTEYRSILAILLKYSSLTSENLKQVAKSDNANKKKVWQALAQEDSPTTEHPSQRQRPEFSELERTESTPPTETDRPRPSPLEVHRNGRLVIEDANAIPVNTQAQCAEGVNLQIFDDIDGVYIWDVKANKHSLAVPGVNSSLTIAGYDDDEILHISNASESGSASKPALSPDAVGRACNAFVFGSEGFYRIRNGAIRKLNGDAKLSKKTNVLLIQLSGEEEFLAVLASGVYRISNDAFEKIDTNAPRQALEGLSPGESSLSRSQSESTQILKNGHDVWVATETSVYVYSAKEKRFDRVPNIELARPQLKSFGDLLWIVGDSGIYRIYPNVSIGYNIDATSTAERWKQFASLLSGGDVLLSGFYKLLPKYVDTELDRSLAKSLPHGQFDFIAARSNVDFEELSRNSRYSAESTPIDISAGHQIFFMRFRDRFGNTVITKSELTAWPSAEVVPLFILAVLGFASILALAAAPYSRTVHMAAMNPWLRRYGSFGLIPLLLTVLPLMRRHVLGRYLKQFSLDSEIEHTSDNFVPPAPDFTYENFVQFLASSRKVFLLGRSGLGKTSFFRYLCSNLSRDAKLPRGWRKPIPIFIPVGRYQDLDPAEMFAAQLAKYGDIHDPELAMWFLRQGNFVLFVDGLNEVSDASRLKINRFLDMASRQNIVCLSSQQRYDDFEWLSVVGLSPLTEVQMQSILARELPRNVVDEFVSELNISTREIYSTPQNLIFARRLLLAGELLPQSRFALYESVFRPIEDRWCKAGSEQLSVILSQRAFEMLSLKLPFLESGGFQVPPMLRSDLIEEKLVARSGKDLLFSHDLVRAYFAASFFFQIWEEDEEIWKRRPDRNWLAMIEFCMVRFTSTSQITQLLERFVAVSSSLAGDVFRLLKRDRPDLVSPETEAAFLKRFAEATIFG